MRNSNFSARDNAIKTLTDNLNNEHKTSLTAEQVAYWVGSDASVKEIDMYAFEVEIISFEAVTPFDITSLWESRL